MRRSLRLSAGLFTAVLMVLNVFTQLPMAVEAQSIYNGPRLDELLFLYYGTPDAEVTAIQKGEVDAVSDLIRPMDVQTLSGNPELNVTYAEQTHYCYLAFNLRRPPLDQKALRKAIAHLIPREKISSQLFQGLVVEPMLYEVMPAFGKWHNPNVETYPYDPRQAERILEEAGYTHGEDGRLLSPDGTPVRKLSFITPTQEEAPTSFEISRIIAGELNALGIPVELETVSFDALLTRVYTKRDFDMYFLCVSGLGRYPRWLYEFYHSNLDVPDGENTPGVRDETLDRLLYAFRFEDSGEEEALAHIHQAQEIIADLAARIPIYSRFKVEAYRKGWVGMINHKGAGYFDSDSFYTWLNLHREGSRFGGVFKVSVGGKVRTLNPLYGAGAYEAKIWKLIYDSLLTSNPYTGEPMPYLAESWEIENIVEGDVKGQRITYHLASNATWHDGEPFTSKDVKFTFEFIKKHQVPMWLPAVEKVLRVEAPDERTVVLTMEGVSMFNLIDTGGLLILPEHIWRDVGEDWRSFQPNLERHPSHPDLTKMVGTGPFILVDHKPGEYWRLKWNPGYFKRMPERVEAPKAQAIGGVPLPTLAAAVVAGGGAAAALTWLRWRRRARGV